MRTYGDVAATTLREFAESNGMYVPTETAEAALAAMKDALVQAGASAVALDDFFDTEAEEPIVEDTWGMQASVGADVIAARDALKVLARALGVTAL